MKRQHPFEKAFIIFTTKNRKTETLALDREAKLKKFGQFLKAQQFLINGQACKYALKILRFKDFVVHFYRQVLWRVAVLFVTT